MWTIKPWDELGRRLKDFEKKWRHEVGNVLDNLDTLLEALDDGAHPEQLKKLNFVHSEPSGVLAIDQKGPGKGTKPKALRLYVFPDLTTETLHAIILGEKDSQGDDLRLATSFVEELRRNSALGGATDVTAG